MADIHAIPNPPVLDLSEMNIRDLVLLADLFLCLSEAGLSIRNQPRCTGGAADFAEEYQSRYINGILDAVRNALRSREPYTRQDAELRAECLIRHLAESETLLEIAMIAMSAAVWNADRERPAKIPLATS